MPLQEYEQFFVAMATVAGALIGLLFVAVSVRPSAAMRSAHITTRVSAISALSVFLDSLFVSLLALLPHTPFGSAVTTLAALGTAAMTVLLVLLVTQGRDRPGTLLRAVVFVVGGGVLYVLQLADGMALEVSPTATAPVDHLGIVLLVFFSFGITRAWEFVGADNPSVLGTIAATVRGRPDSARRTLTEPAGGDVVHERRCDGSTSG